MPEISALIALTLRRPAGMQELSRESAQAKHVVGLTYNILLYFDFSFNERGKKKELHEEVLLGGVDRSRTYQ